MPYSVHNEVRFIDAVAAWLNRCTVLLLPEDRRAWGRALIAEQHNISDARERLAWAAGGIAMSTKELVSRVFGDLPVWAAGLGLGMVSALIDLRSGSRWLYVVLLCSFALTLALWQPRGAWRWVLPLALSLPLLVLITNNWGPYAVDRFDVFYGIVPAAIGATIGVTGRRLSERLRHGSARH